MNQIEQSPNSPELNNQVKVVLKPVQPVKYDTVTIMVPCPKYNESGKFIRHIEEPYQYHDPIYPLKEIFSTSSLNGTGFSITINVDSTTNPRGDSKLVISRNPEGEPQLSDAKLPNDHYLEIRFNPEVDPLKYFSQNKKVPQGHFGGFNFNNRDRESRINPLSPKKKIPLNVIREMILPGEQGGPTIRINIEEQIDTNGQRVYRFLACSPQLPE